MSFPTTSHPAFGQRPVATASPWPPTYQHRWGRALCTPGAGAYVRSSRKSEPVERWAQGHVGWSQEPPPQRTGLGISGKEGRRSLCTKLEFTNSALPLAFSVPFICPRLGWHICKMGLLVRNSMETWSQCCRWLLCDVGKPRSPFSLNATICTTRRSDWAGFGTLSKPMFLSLGLRQAWTQRAQHLWVVWPWPKPFPNRLSFLICKLGPYRFVAQRTIVQPKTARVKDWSHRKCQETSAIVSGGQAALCKGSDSDASRGTTLGKVPIGSGPQFPGSRAGDNNSSYLQEWL